MSQDSLFIQEFGVLPFAEDNNNKISDDSVDTQIHDIMKLNYILDKRIEKLVNDNFMEDAKANIQRNYKNGILILWHSAEEENDNRVKIKLNSVFKTLNNSESFRYETPLHQLQFFLQDNGPNAKIYDIREENLAEVKVSHRLTLLDCVIEEQDIDITKFLSLTDPNDQFAVEEAIKSLHSYVTLKFSEDYKNTFWLLKHIFCPNLSIALPSSISFNCNKITEPMEKSIKNNEGNNNVQNDNNIDAFDKNVIKNKYINEDDKKTPFKKNYDNETIFKQILIDNVDVLDERLFISNFSSGKCKIGDEEFYLEPSKMLYSNEQIDIIIIQILKDIIDKNFLYYKNQCIRSFTEIQEDDLEKLKEFMRSCLFEQTNEISLEVSFNRNIIVFTSFPIPFGLPTEIIEEQQKNNRHKQLIINNRYKKLKFAEAKIMDSVNKNLENLYYMEDTEKLIKDRTKYVVATKDVVKQREINKNKMN